MNNIKFVIYKNKYKLMAVLLALLCLIIVVLIFNIFSGNNNSNDNVATNNIESLTDSEDSYLTGDSRFLLVCDDKTQGDIIFMTLIDFKIYSEKIIITPLDSNTKSVSGTYSQAYSYGGISMLINNIEAERNCNIDRYVIINEKGFCDIIDLMGKVEIDIKNSFTYDSSDKSYTVTPGINEMEAPMLYSYVKLNTNSNDKDFADLLCHIVNTYLNNFDISKAQDYFESLANCVNSDLSINDYYSAQKDIEYIINNNTQCVPYYLGEQ